MRVATAAPEATIGLPVYNGENFAEDAIRSVLAQDFDDLELVIFDNASTDRTEEICRDHAAADPRVRYFRNPRNLGAAPNYNLAWGEGRGRFFKWLAHDDRIRPGFVSAAVQALEARPDAVLCNSVVDYIDDAGEVFAQYDSGLDLADRDRPSERLAAMVLRSHSCVDFFGMIRRSAMEDSLLHGPFHGADRAFLAQMALRGRLVRLPGVEVEMREHANRYTRVQASARARRAWHDAGAGRWQAPPAVRLMREYLRLVAQEPMSEEERRRCKRVLARWWTVDWNAARVGTDLASLLIPGLRHAAERAKSRVFGLAPGHFPGR